MAEEINIKSPDELQAWLQGKSAEWSQMIALRAALRVFPFGTSVLVDRTTSKNVKQDLILQSWRAMFISSVAHKYPTDDMMRASRAAAYAASRADAADAAANASRAAAYAAANAASNAASAAVWEAVSCDCRLLAELGTDGLMKRDIWEPEKQGVEGKTEHGPDWIWIPTRQLADLQNIFGSSWALITNWYFAHASGLSSGNEKFWLSKDAETLALKPNEFWKITDDRTADQVMDECAEVLGWHYKAEPKNEKSLAQFIIEFLEESAEPRTIDEIRAALDAADYDYIDKTMRGELSRLAKDEKIIRVETGVYASNGSAKIHVPKQEPAPIETAIIDNQIVRIHSDHMADGPETSNIHRILRTEAAYLAERLGKQAPDAASSLQSIAMELGTTPEETQIYGVGYWASVLNQIAARLEDEVLGDAAGRFAGFIGQINLFLRQSDAWNAYIQKAQQAELNALKGTDVESGTKNIVVALSNNENLVSNDVTGPLSFLNSALLDAPIYNPETAYGFYRSLANVLQAVVELIETRSIQEIDKFAVDLGKGARKAVIAGMLATAAIQIMSLTNSLPGMFGFITPFLKKWGLG